jgi:hypothetical protein
MMHGRKSIKKGKTIPPQTTKFQFQSSFISVALSDKLARDGSFQKFVGPEPFFGVSRKNIRRKIKRWMDNQYLVM